MSRIARQRSQRLVFALILAAAIGASGAALGQPLSFNPDDPAPTLIPFKPEPELGEHVGRAEGVVGPDGKRFYLNELNVMSPLVIQVFAKDESRPIDVSLHRFFWKTAEREGRTSKEGNWGFAGRVHNEVGIELRADEPSEFYVLAWQGPAAQVRYGAASVFVAAGDGGDASGGSKTALLAGAAFVLLAALALLALRLRRGGAAARAACLGAGLVMVAAAAHAEGFDARLAQAQSNIRTLFEDTTNLMNQIERDRERSEFHYDALSERLDAIRRGLDRLGDEAYSNTMRSHDLGEGLQFVFDQHNALSQRVDAELSNIYDHIQTLYMLVEQDREAIPDPNRFDVAPMPSRCLSDAACRPCFAAANARLTQRMASYETMRVIYQSTETFMARMVDLGNSMSGWHQLEQAAWFRQKARIYEAEERLEAAYRNKYTEFNADLMAILEDFAACEARAGVDDWMTRYGTLFYNSLVTGYRIP